MIIYLLYLNIINIEFYSFSSNEYGQFSHIFEDLKEDPFLLFFKTIPIFFYKFTLGIFSTFHVWLLLFFIGIIQSFQNKTLNKNQIIFILILFFMLFAQFVGSNATGIVLPDVSFIIFLMSAYFLSNFFLEKSML